MEDKNYKKGVAHEFGLDVPRDYKKALEYYKLATEETPHARRKIKYSNFSIVETIILLVILITGIIVDSLMTFPWVGLFIIGMGFTIVSIFYLKKYWILNGYAYILNISIFFIGLGLITPYSVIKPYLNGITWIPVVLLFSVSLFFAFSTLILFFIDKNKIYLAASIISFLLLIGTIVSFNIDTPDKLYSFVKVEDGIEITGYRQNATKIKIPNKINGYDVVSIANEAFAERQFEEVILNSNLKRIGANAFKNNRVLTSIEIPDGVTLYYGVFAGNHSLVDVKLPSDLEVIPISLFEGCISLETIDIPNSVTTIYHKAFRQTKLKNIDIPNSVQIIGNNVFTETQIKELNLPEELIYLGTLSGMSYLETFNFPKNMTEIPARFLESNKTIKHLEIPERITHIGEYAFTNTNIETLIIPNTTTFDEGLFFQSKQLKAFTIPSSMTSIPKNTFAFSGLETIHIPSTINYIGINAFGYARNLHTVTFEEGVKSIESGAFMFTESLREITIPESVITLGSEMFKGASKLERVTVPSHTIAIPDRFLEDAYSMKYFNFANSIKTIGASSFKNNAFTSVTLPESLQVIDDYAFFGNKQLQNITFNNNLRVIKTHSFGSNTSLKVLDFPISLISIDDYSFNGCSNIETIYLKQNVEIVGYWAFKTNKTMTVYIICNPYHSNWSLYWNPYGATVIIQ
ncbi:MAG TPA: leucine-rich repeat protein [Acholeplasmataceae bacterium]|nr:leucine-rich repeat protein [Acholeplasmataceae bacterium]